MEGPFRDPLETTNADIPLNDPPPAPPPLLSTTLPPIPTVIHRTSLIVLVMAPETFHQAS